MVGQESKTLSRGIDYFGSLSRILRDLSGPTTLIYELLQNADDAPGAASILFNLTDGALIVWNDGVFADCGDQDLAPDDCLWLREKEPPERCDFHRFRSVSAGDKSGRLDLTGAFGIGFTAVYQITDKPELISGGRHWIIDETLPEVSRIHVCTGCGLCRREEGTRLILPWATDPESTFRVRAKVPPIDKGGIDSLLDVLVGSGPTVMLFLKKIRAIEIQRSSHTVAKFQRVDEADDILIDDGKTLGAWRILRGDFEEDARVLRSKYPEKLEKLTGLAIAIPHDQDLQGRLCAYLPTEEGTGMPFHVNADFFPRSDRKGLITDGYQGEWNAAAVGAAACLLAEHLSAVRSVYGHRRLWAMINAAHQVATNDNTKRRGLALESFWPEIARRLENAPIAWTIAQEWTTPSAAYIVRDADESQCARVLSDLGSPFTHPDLRQYCLNLPRYGGLKQLTLAAFIEMLEKVGLNRRHEIRELPEPLKEMSARLALLQELERLLARSADQRNGLRPRLDVLALAPGIDGALWPWRQCFSGDSATRHLLARAFGSYGFLDQHALPEDSAHLRDLVTPFGIEQALGVLEADGALVTKLDAGKISSAELLEWLTARGAELEDAPSLAQRLALLPVYPTAGTHKRLADLVLPGGFPDELGLSDVVDLGRAGNALPLLRRLGCSELTLPDYVERFVGKSKGLAQTDPTRWRQLILLLASRLGDIEGSGVARDVLRHATVVITDQGFAAPANAYFGTESVERVLDRYTRAVLPRGHELALRAFYEWVGVATDPRPQDVIERVLQLAAGPVTDKARAAVTAIVGYLGTRWKSQPRPPWGDLVRLKNLAWLPARDDSTRWYRPDELYAGFSDYLFATQAHFLGLPMSAQQDASEYLFALGVGAGPTTAQVVAHLLKCAKDKTGMNTEVYAFLNTHSHESEVAILQDQECILLPDGRWVSPRWVFWGDQPFGRFRGKLGEDFHRYRPLLNRLGVREAPDHTDALDVLLDISRELSAMNTPLESEEDRLVYASCWRILADALGSQTIEPGFFSAFGQHKVIADGGWLLTHPHWILFDDVPGLADRFPKDLKRQLIKRPEGYWPAMRAAGVRDLSRATVSKTLELGEHADHKDLRRLLQAYTRQLGRVIDAVDPQWPVTIARRVAALNLVVASDLLVQFVISEFNLTSPAVILPALYDAGTDTLFIRRDVPFTELEVAREVARALAPDVAPGTLAASLALVLGATTSEEADRRLDAAGVPRLAQGSAGEAEVQVVTGFGGDSSPAETLQSVSLQAHGDHAGGDLDEGLAGSGGADDAKAGKDGQSPRKGRLRSYVLSGAASANESNAGPEDDQDITALDRAGVDKVLDFERKAGRNPKEMPHYNPGYDVESAGADGQVLRYIEVKSLEGEWISYGVSVTPRQMNEARGRREMFWLYVVERANSADPAIHTIQDPWGKVDQFLFDDPWMDAAEGPGPLSELSKNI